MDIIANDLGKRYGRNWIFRHLSFQIKSGARVAITGKNGAGKSTLLQIISGYLSSSQGSIKYGELEDTENLPIVLIGPYTELIEEFTLEEFLEFHTAFRKPLKNMDSMAKNASLPLQKYIGDFSTGMKQRVKLITAFYFENEVILFDEPTSNLDDEGFLWWQKEMQNLHEKTIIIGSNQQNEIKTCANSIQLT